MPFSLINFSLINFRLQIMASIATVPEAIPFAMESVFMEVYPDTSHLSSLYTRQAYIDLDKLVHDLYQNRGNREIVRCNSVVITGTPGVGKSMFLIYEIDQARKRELDVVIQIGDFYGVFDSNRNVVSVSAAEAKDHLRNPDCMYFFDPAFQSDIKLKLHRAFTVVFSSNEDNYRCLNKSNYVLLYMPVWTLTELLICRQQCFAQYSEETVKTTFKKWGGSARSVFVSSREVLERNFQNFLSSDLNMAISDMEGVYHSKNPQDQHQWLVHISIFDRDYSKPTKNWASQHVLRKIYTALQIQTMDVYNPKYIYSHDIELRGQLYELKVQEALGSGKSFKATNISTGETVVIPPSIGEPNFFTNTHVVGGNEDTLYIPCEDTRESIGFVKGEWIFQATLRKTHDIKAHGVSTIAKQFKREHWFFCFCIPEARMEDYNRKMKVVGTLLNGLKITQFKLAI